jgi:hypothetical protein
MGMRVTGEVGGPHVTRRTVFRTLGGSALASLTAAGCGGEARSAAVSRTSDDLIRDRAIAASRALGSLIRGELAGHPSLAGSLKPLLAEHERHVTVLAAGYQDPPTAAAAPTPPRGASTATPTATATTDPAAAIAGIVAAERATSHGRTAEILAASGDLARLLASIAACELVAAQTLGGAR